MRRRTRAREIAVQFLYQLDLRGDEALEFLHEHVESQTDDKEVQDFAIRLIQGARRHQPETDVRLREVTKNWDLGRLEGAVETIVAKGTNLEEQLLAQIRERMPPSTAA